ACSRTPKQKVRPAGSLRENTGTPATVVLLDPARSAEPPTSSGKRGERAARTLPEAARVAIAASAAKVGRAACQSAGKLPWRRRGCCWIGQGQPSGRPAPERGAKGPREPCRRRQGWRSGRRRQRSAGQRASPPASPPGGDGRARLRALGTRAANARGAVAIRG